MTLLFLSFYYTSLIVFPLFGLSILIFLFNLNYKKNKQKILNPEQLNSLQIFEQTILCISDCINISDLEDNIIFVNDAFCTTYGFSREEIIGKHVSILRSTLNSEEEIKSIYRDTMDSGFEGELYNRKKDGTDFLIHLKTSLIKDQNGIPFASAAIARDITEIKLSEKRNAENQRQLSTLMRNLPGIAYRCLNDNVWSMLFISDGCFTLTGYTATDFLSKEITLLEIMHNEDRGNVREAVNKSLQLGTSFTVSYRIYTASGELRWMWEQGRTVAENENGVAVIEGFITDITERVETLQALRQSEERYKTFIAQSTEGIYRMELTNPVSIHLPVERQIELLYEDCVISECNETMAKMYGFDKADDLIGKTTSELHGSTDNPTNRNAYRKLINSSYRIVGEETEEVDKDGNKKYYLNNATGIIENGYLVRIWGTQTDITEKIETEKKIRLLAHTTESITEIVAVTNLDNNFIYVNKSFIETYGYNEDDVIGKNISLIISRDNNENVIKEILHPNYKESLKKEVLSITSEGKVFPVSLITSPLKDKLGNPTGLVVISSDISEAKKIREELIEAKETAEEASKFKTSLLSNMSHELRTPMNGILGFAQILQEELEENMHADLADKIVRSGNRLMKTLNSILNLAELESSNIIENFKEVNIEEIIITAAKNHEINAYEKGLYFDVEIEKTKLSSFLNEYLLNQVVNHLIDNAIKYTNEGGITLRVSTEQDAKQNYIVLKVIDTGIGIPEESLDIIFHEFKQLSEGTARVYEGSGLGLTIVKKMVELMNGSISVKSRINFGSTFIVKFPRLYWAEVDEEITKKEIPVLPKNNFETGLPLVLIVEDNYINREVLEYYLNKKYVIDHASNGEKAIELCTEKEYYCILMDINLGVGIDGVEATNKIKQLKGKENTPIIAVTGYSSTKDKERFLSSGFDGYLVKPIEKKELYSLLEKITVQ